MCFAWCLFQHLTLASAIARTRALSPHLRPTPMHGNSPALYTCSDGDGYLNVPELENFQRRVFKAELTSDQVESLEVCP
jgi:hypothetical protein